MQLYDIFLQHSIICTDSRDCPEGSLFFALKGDNFNANAFALMALEKGCAYAVVDEPEFAIDDRFMLVDNVLETLQQLATFHRKQLGTTIIGITGTNGKTTTKELIAAVLQEKFNILYTKGNLNNHIGVPLTLLQLRPEHQLAVIEMGANHPGDIKLLTNITCPDVGLITNVGKAHLEGFGSFEGVMTTKAELYDYLWAENKKVFINKGNEYLVEMVKKAGFVTSEQLLEYCLEPNKNTCSIYGQVSNCSPFLNMNCVIEAFPIEIKTQLIGAYNAENVLAAVAIGHYFGVESNKIVRGLENYIPQNNRSQLTITENNKLVVDAYNANPTSLGAAILNFAQMDVLNKTLILGDMLELGEQSEKEHQNMIDLLKQNQLYNVLLVGSEFKKANHQFPVFDNVDSLINYLQEKPIKNNYILIKGSRGIKLEKVVPIL